MRILAISGSLRADSLNTALAYAAVSLAPPFVEVEVYESLAALPPYDGDTDGDDASVEVIRLREQIVTADAVLLVTPEYNGSVSGVLKNAVAWASRPREAAPLAGKTVAIAGVSTGWYGAAWAQADLRRILGIAGARVIEGDLPVARATEKFNPDGALVDETTRERLRAQLQALAVVAADPRAAEPIAA